MNYLTAYNEQTLSEFWDTCKAEIANWRHWECKSDTCPSSCQRDCSKASAGCQLSCKNSCWRNCPSNYLKRRMDGCITLRTYDRFASRLSEYLSMGISQITPHNVAEVLAIIQREGRNGQEYSEATVENYRTFLRVLFRFAQEMGVAYDIMHFEESLTTALQRISYPFDRPLTKAEEKAALRKLYQKVQNLPRSLTIWQQEKLLKLIRKNITTDGRYLAVAIILYAGLRPAECRGLLWKDIVPFQDHPDCHLINIYKTRDDKGRLKEHVKTKNGYRRIPVHCELDCLIAERLSFLREQVPAEDIGNLPICCFGNEFSRPCKEHHLSSFAMDLFQQLRLSMDDLLPYYVEQQLDEKEDMLPQHLTLYVLRRNFWTWLASSTQLSDLDKRYVMGHDMVVHKHDYRKHYNNENRLYEIAQHMNRCILSKDLHEPFLVHTLNAGHCTYFSNQGVVRIKVPRDLLRDDSKLHLLLSSETAGEAIRMKVLAKPKGNFSLSAQVEALEPKPQPARINCQYENWLAHQKPTAPRMPDTDVTEETDL